MMKSFIRATFRAALIFCLSGDLLLISYSEAAIPAFCTATVNQKRSIQPMEIQPVYVNASEYPDPTSESYDLTLELCPNNTTLKLSWRMNQSQGLDIILCYKMKAIYDERLLQKKCVRFFVESLKKSSTVTCWFPMDYIAYRPIITAAAEAIGHGRKYNFDGQLNTTGLDLNNTCSSNNVCEQTILEPTRSIISCDDTSSVFFDDKVTIKAVWFDGIGSSVCKDSPVFISMQTPNKLEYSLNCTYHGLGHIKVLYSVHDQMCLKYQTVRVVCDIVPSTTVVSTTSDADSFETFVVFGVVCMIVITAIVVILNFVVQKLKLVFEARRRSTERNPIDVNGRESLPLTPNNFQQEGHVPEPILVNPVHPVDKVIKKEYLKRVDSMSSEGQVSMSSSARGQNVRKLHRSVTVALLENTETFYRKKILFLPTPFDTFSRDAANLLKAVFTLELNIPTQCCFDRDLQYKYNASDRYKWIETVLGDYDKILIFLCFTTIGGEAKGDSRVDDVLDHILLTRIRPRCKVVFLHVTDSSQNLEKNHHGNSFHLCDKDSYTAFVGEVLNYCGRNPLTEPDLLYKVANCDTSKHFLGYIGKGNI